jgi:hypothetical protein
MRLRSSGIPALALLRRRLPFGLGASTCVRKSLKSPSVTPLPRKDATSINDKWLDQVSVEHQKKEMVLTPVYHVATYRILRATACRYTALVAP